MSIKKLLRTIVLPALLFISISLWSQDTKVTGKVTDSKDGSGLAGVSVLVKGTKTGTSTDANGNFTIQAPANAVLVFSSVGFANRELSASEATLNVSLVASANSQLNEVVVIAYGTAKKKDLTGAVATVSSKDFQKGAISTPEQLIAGKVPGVSIISNSGQPGAGSQIRIRGGSSLSASNDPLIVIDGVPLDNSEIKGAGNPLSFINANDIESFTILKDASAAAIYGTRASNGVVIITTKKGKGGALKVGFSSLNSLAKITKKVDVLTGDEVRSVVNAKAPERTALLGTANTDWQDLIYQTAFATDNNISITGGIKKLPYRLSFGYLNQAGVLKTDKLEKFSGSLALNPTFFDNHLKVDLNLKGASENTRFGNTDAIGGAISFDPTQPVYSPSKSLRYGGFFEWTDTTGKLIGNTGHNPVGLIEQRINKSTPFRSIGNLQLDYKFHFLPDLRANVNLGYDIAKGEGTDFISDSAASNYKTVKGINNQDSVVGGQSDKYKNEKKNTLFEAYLAYARDLKSIKSRVDVMAGYSYNNYLTTNYYFNKYNAKGDSIGAPERPYSVDKPENTLISFFGRLNYTFNEKYLVTATFRRDGSSRFAPSNRWANFPSIALAWRVKDEGFLKNSNLLSDLKLRFGYGITGQQDGIGNYDYLSYYALSSITAAYEFGGVYYQGYRPGGFYANRKWEETATTNLAIDYGFANNRITGSVDFYYKKTSDLLNNVPAPAGTNFSSYVIANVGDMENKGVEFSVNVAAIKSKEFNWDFNFNITYNKNKITNLTVVPNDPHYIGLPVETVDGAQGFLYLDAVDGPKNTFYLYKQVYGKDGKPVEGFFEDLNRDGIINENDKYKGKTADPNVFMGFSTNLSYKKWNAGFTMRSNLNNYVYNNMFSKGGRLNQINGGNVISNANTNYLETNFVGGNDKQLLSDYYIENASFLRMDNVNIGYNFGKILNKIANLRASFVVQNVFVITKYKGLDPELTNGKDNNFYPRPRIYALGVNLDF